MLRRIAQVMLPVVAVATILAVHYGPSTGGLRELALELLAIAYGAYVTAGVALGKSVQLGVITSKPSDGAVPRASSLLIGAGFVAVGIYLIAT